MASAGSSRRWSRGHASLLLAALVLAPDPAIAQVAKPRITIAETTLDAALTTLARQSGADIISTEPGLRGVRVRRLSGRMPVRAALDRLLRDSGYRAVEIDANSYRVVRGAPPRTARRSPPAAEAAPVADIIVTGSKQQLTLLRFPGSVVVARRLPSNLPAQRAPDIDELARGTPVLQNTELGAGRNKIFIRGIADSSFNGATQSTAGIYFGDVQLGYSGPEPSLSLYDIQGVEVLEGPQGTLYGAGAIGGIIRVTPMPVNLTRIEGSAGAGLTGTAGGGPGYDVSGMVNLPLIAQSVGLRAVAYHQHDGGYVEDQRRRLRGINRTDTTGGRVSLLIEPGDDWSVDLGALTQHIDSTDAQYAEVAVGPLARRSVLAQPFHNSIRLGRAVISKKWDTGLSLLSATGIVGNDSNDVFDASRAPWAIRETVYHDDRSNLLLTHETRLSRTSDRGTSWVMGVALLYDRAVQSRSLGPPGDPNDIIGVTNVTKSASLFAEATLPLSPSLSITPGARFTWARTDSEPSVQPRAAAFIPGRTARRIDPTIGFSWLVAPRIAAFGRFQSGFRTGGLAVARGVGRVADFRPDSINLGEIGLRMERSGATGLALSTSLSFAHWSDIQADLVNRNGAPYTDNIGNADIIALEGTGDWVPIPGLHATASFLYTHNRVTGPLAESSVMANRRLPETPEFAGNVGVDYRWPDGHQGEFRVGATARYVGGSVLGTGDYLDIRQGKYGVLGLSGGWKTGRFDFSLVADNLANAKANRFALGNPFILATRDQTTPLRPLNVRAGIGVSW